MKKALSIALVLTMMMSLTACGDKTDKNVDDTQANTETSQTEQVEQTEKHDVLNDSIFLKPEILGEAISGHDFLNDNFTFEKDTNQLIEMYSEDTTKYIASETWIWNGVQNTGASSYFLEGEKASYSISMQRVVGEDYPSNIGITFTSSDSIDFENMASWSHEIIGTCLPPKLAKAFQNASFEGLTENTYSVGNLETSVYKNTSYKEDNTVVCEMNIMIKDKNAEEGTPKFGDIKKFISDKGSKLGLYKLLPFDLGSSITNMETRLADIFDKDVKSKLVTLSTYDSVGVNTEATSAYAVFALQSVGNAEIEISTDSVTDLNTGNVKNTVYVGAKTLPYADKKDAYKSAERIIDGLFGCSPDFSSLVDTEAGGEMLLTDSENDTYGLPLLVELKLVTNTDKTYTIEITANTAEVSFEAENAGQ